MPGSFLSWFVSSATASKLLKTPNLQTSPLESAMVRLYSQLKSLKINDFPTEMGGPGSRYFQARYFLANVLIYDTMFHMSSGLPRSPSGGISPLPFWMM